MFAGIIMPLEATAARSLEAVGNFLIIEFRHIMNLKFKNI